MNHEIRLYDVIGGYGMTAKDIADAIPADATEITVRINSPGGAVSDGLAIYNYLRDHAATVTTIVDGYAASAASIVMLAGDVRQVHESSIVVIHNPWTIASGDSRDMRKNADVLDELQKALIGIYTERTGVSGDELQSMLDVETWMRGSVAHEFGFADEIIRYEEDEEGKQAASIHFGRMLEIINGGNELMSKVKTRKEIEAEAAEVEAKLTDVSATVETVTAERDEAQAKIEEVNAQIEVIKAEAEEAKAALIAEHEAKIGEVNAELIEAKAAVDVIKAELETVKEEADKAKAALVNPAVADASINTPAQVPEAQLDADADAAEVAAQEAEAEATPQNVAEEWEAMEAGQARVDFWNKNKKTIMAIIGAR